MATIEEADRLKELNTDVLPPAPIVKDPDQHKTFLASDQLKYYQDYSFEATLPPSDRILAQHGIQGPYDYRTTMTQKLLESRASAAGYDAQTIMESFFIEEGGAANKRQYGNHMDPYYRLPTGETDWDLIEEDRFIVRIEKAFMNNGGEVPLQFFLAHPEDLDLLGGALKGTATKLWAMAYAQDVNRQTKLREQEEMSALIDEVQKYNDVGRSAAVMAWTNFPGLAAIAGDDLERGQELLDDVAPGLNYRSMLATYTGEQQPSSLGDIVSTLESAAISATAIPDDPNSGALKAAKWGLGWISDRTADFGTGLSTIGGALGDAVGGLFSGAPDLNAALGPAAHEALAGATNAASLGRGGQGYIDAGATDRAAQVAWMEKQLGKSNIETMADISKPAIDEIFARLPVDDPVQYGEYMAMANGDPQMAGVFFFADKIWGTSEMDKANEAVEQYKSETEVVLKDVRDHNYTLVESVFEGMALYGSVIEDMAVDATLIVQSLFDGSAMVFDEQYFQDRANYDTPADVLGLEGTFTGLIANIGIPAVVDPANLFFLPGLSSAGRWGAGSIDDVTRIMGRATTKVELEDLVKIIRGIGYDAVTEEAMLAALRTTPNGRYISQLIRGQSKSASTLGRSLDTGKEVMTAVDSVHIGALADHPGALLTAQEHAAKLASLQDDGVETIMLGVNPNTGATKILKGEETLTVLRGEGFDGLNVAVKYDLGVGEMPNPNYVRAVNTGDDIKIAAGDLAVVKRAATHLEKFPVVATVKLKNGSSIVIRGAGDSMGAFDEATGKFLGGITNGLKNNPTGAVIPGTKSGGVMDALADQIDGVFTGMSKAEIKGATAEGNAFIESYLARHTTREKFVSEFDDLQGRVLGAEKQGTAADWTAAQQAAYNSGDMNEFSRLRGYTEEEIADWNKYQAEIGDAPANAVQKPDGSVDGSSLYDYTRPIPKTIADPDAIIAEWAQGIGLDDAAINLSDGMYQRPSALMPEELYMPGVQMEEVERAYRQHLLDGGDPIGANKTMIARQVGSTVGDFFRTDAAVGKWIKDFMQPINADRSVGLAGSYGEAQVNQIGGRLYSAVKDQNGWVPFQRRIVDYYENIARLEVQADTLSAEIRNLRGTRQGIIDNAGGLHPEPLGGIAVETTAHARAIMEAKKIEDEVVTLLDKMIPIQAKMSDHLELQTILKDMMEDFNRRHIATNPKWAKFVDENGLVPDRYLQLGQGGKVEDRTLQLFEAARYDGLSLVEAAEREIGEGLVPASMIKQLEALGEDAATLNARLDNAIEVLRHGNTYTLPASPLELMAAATGGPNALRTTTEHVFKQQIAEGLTKVHTAWVIDKVMTPRTGVTVSLDELLFGFHRGGYKNLWRYMEDQAVKVADTVTTAKGTAAWDQLPQRWKDRLVGLQEYPIYLRQQERAFLELNGTSFETIPYKKLGPNTEYYAAANRTAQNLLSDKGFQAYVKGREAFDTWFQSETTASRVRELEFLDASTGVTRTGLTGDDLWQTYETMQKWMTMNLKSKDHGKAMAEWAKAAEAASLRGSTKAGPTAVPDWLLRGFGEVQGVARHGSSGPVNQIMRFPGAVFNNPLNYRRGFNAEWVRQSEMARLSKLFESQGREVVSNADFMELLRLRYPNAGFDLLDNSMTSMADEIMRSTGKVSQRYVDELVESKVIFEIENMQYSFTMESQIGKRIRGLAPFGKPYADMVGRWAREFGTRPQLRGWINDTNFLNMSNIANKAVDQLPFNPRTFAFLSRTANTDFDLDRIQEDPLVGGIARWAGVEELDVGVGLFLLHRGQNPVTVLLPGLGIVPVASAQVIFTRFQPDPIKDPLAYEAYIEKWSEWVPALGYSQPKGFGQMFGNLMMGGGATKKLIEFTEASVTAATGTRETQAFGSQSWRPQILANQQVKLSLSTGDFLEELADLPYGMVDMGISALLDEELAKIVDDANKSRAVSAGKEILLEASVPVRATFDGIQDDNQQAWIDNMGTLGLTLPSYMNTSTPEKKAQAADWIRGQFFSLADWERDLAVAENPGLAVNLVSMWKWTDLGKDTTIPGNDVPYSSGGSKEDFARHAGYRDKGYIQPVTPKELVTNIIGTILQARFAVKREAYTEGARIVNEERWNNWKPEIHAFWQETADELREAGVLPYRTGQEAWKNYEKVKEQMEILHPPKLDKEGEIVEGTDFTVPQKFLAWGEEMPGGLDGSALRSDFEEGNWTILRVSPKLERLAAALGLDWSVDDPDDTLGMFEIWHAVNDQFSEELMNNPIFAYTDAGYRNYMAPRSAGFQATQSYITNTLKSTLFNQETRQLYGQTDAYISEAQQRKSMGDDSWKTLAKEAKDRWNRMFMDDAWTNADPEFLWDQAYGKTLGALNWVPDEPVPLDSPDAKKVYVREILDGDTIDVAQGRAGFGGGTKVERVRLLGWNAKELGQGGEAEKEALRLAIEEAIANGVAITIVTDEKRYGLSDLYGRKFAWLYIGDKPWYNADTMIPRRD